ncbi:hypothetical protein AB5V95_01965 [Metamycoplasma spumans]|uniref:hypothetical protein n=1 Tax=Metamycoplasma spumans TaxID=92406 RepID=UPI0034DDA201
MKKIKFMLASFIPLAAVPAVVMSATDGSENNQEEAKNNLKAVIETYNLPVLQMTRSLQDMGNKFESNRVKIYLSELTFELLGSYGPLSQKKEDLQYTSKNISNFISIFTDTTATLGLISKYLEITEDPASLAKELEKNPDHNRDTNKVREFIVNGVSAVLKNKLDTLDSENKKKAEQILALTEEKKTAVNTFTQAINFYKDNLVAANEFKTKLKEFYTSELIGTYLDKLYEDLNTQLTALENKKDDLDYISKNILYFVASFDSYMEILNLLQRYSVYAHETELFNAQLEKNKENVGDDLAKITLSIIHSTTEAAKKSKEMSAEEIAKLTESIKEKETEITRLQNELREKEEKIKELVGNTDQNALATFEKAINFYKANMVVFGEFKNKLKSFYTGSLISSYLDKLYENLDQKLALLEKNKDNLTFISNNILDFVASFDSYAEISNLLQRYKVENNETELFNSELEKNKAKTGDDLDKITLSIINAVSSSLKISLSNKDDKIKELESKNKELTDQINQLLDKNSKPKRTFGTTEIILAVFGSTVLFALILTVSILIKNRRRH